MGETDPSGLLGVDLNVAPGDGSHTEPLPAGPHNYGPGGDIILYGNGSWSYRTESSTSGTFVSGQFGGPFDNTGKGGPATGATGAAGSQRPVNPGMSRSQIKESQDHYAPGDPRNMGWVPIYNNDNVQIGWRFPSYRPSGPAAEVEQAIRDLQTGIAWRVDQKKAIINAISGMLPTEIELHPVQFTFARVPFLIGEIPAYFEVVGSVKGHIYCTETEDGTKGRELRGEVSLEINLMLGGKIGHDGALAKVDKAILDTDFSQPEAVFGTPPKPNIPPGDITIKDWSIDLKLRAEAAAGPHVTAEGTMGKYTNEGWQLTALKADSYRIKLSLDPEAGVGIGIQGEGTTGFTAKLPK